MLHFASPASPKDYLDMPIQTLKVGSLGTHNTLGLAKAKGARFFLASTSEVYGDPKVHPQTEDYWGHVNPVGPRGVYDEAKRFAEAMTMAYHRYHGLEVRIVRIFNSILADEQVLYDDGRELRRETVGELAARLGGSAALDGYEVPAFDRDGRMRSAETIALEGHPTSARCFEVRTRYGRSIRVTGDHSLFVEGVDGPVAKPVEQLAVGDRIAIARRVEVPERDRREIDVVEAWETAGRRSVDALRRVAGSRRDRLGTTAGAVRPLRRAPPPDDEVAGATGSGRRSSRCGEADWVPVGALRRARHRPPTSTRSYGRARLGAPLHCRPGSTSPTSCSGSSACTWPRAATRSGPVTATSSSQVTKSSCERAAKVVDRELGLHVVRVTGASPGCAAHRSFVHSKLLLASDGLDRLRPRSQAHPRLDPRPAARSAQVVHRGVPGG